MVNVNRNIAVAGSNTNNNAVSVISSHDIGLYGVNSLTGTCDGFLAFPVPSLGTEYYTISYFGQSGDTTMVGLVAAADGTVVTVTTRPGVNQQYPQNGPLTSGGFPFTINMNRYQVVQLQNSQDLSGTFISSNKPISVFSGNRYTRVPSSATSTDESHLVGMIPRKESLGRSFYAIPAPER